MQLRPNERTLCTCAEAVMPSGGTRATALDTWASSRSRAYTPSYPATDRDWRSPWMTSRASNTEAAKFTSTEEAQPLSGSGAWTHPARYWNSFSRSALATYPSIAPEGAPAPSPQLPGSLSGYSRNATLLLRRRRVSAGVAGSGGEPLGTVFDPAQHSPLHYEGARLHRQHPDTRNERR